jgi:hypothetical protein
MSRRVLLRAELLLGVVLAGGMLAGCTPSGRPPDWSAVSPCLPPGLTLDTEFCPLPDGEGCEPEQRLTVKRCLEGLGVHVESGKLYDASGKEIYFYQHPMSSPPPNPEQVAQQRDERDRLNQLKQRYTVVEMFPTFHGV